MHTHVLRAVEDTFADARQNDVQNLAEEMEDEIAKDRKSLAKLFPAAIITLITNE